MEQTIARTLTETYENLPADEFGSLHKERWETICVPILETLENAIERNAVSPLEAGKIFAAVTGEVFGYSEMHGGITKANPSELVSVLGERLRG